MGVDAIVALVSLLGPKLIDLVRGWFGAKQTPEQVLAGLASTNPAALAQYVEAQAKLISAENASVNADISGTISVWVSDIRAMIRPFVTVVAAVHIVLAAHWKIAIPQEAMYVYEAAICSWFGSKLSK